MNMTTSLSWSLDQQCHAGAVTHAGGCFGAGLGAFVAAALGRTAAEAPAQPRSRGIRAARYRHMLAEIDKRLAEPMLNGERIARALGVCERYVQQLFEENGSTISSHILDRRLDAARRLLADPAQDHRSITDIVYACGFSDLSYFCRAFRRKFGRTAKEMRAR